jgi:hypothetical protein
MAPMTTKRLKRPRDPIQLGKLIVDIATGQVEDITPEPMNHGKNPAAVALGRLGASKGGNARAQRLTPERRSKIARAAATKRWKRD